LGYKIDIVTVSGDASDSGDITTWEASSNLPGSDIHTKKTKTWTDETLESIAREIAEKYDLELVYDCKGPISLSRHDQSEQTDFCLLLSLSETYGVFCSIKGGKYRPTIVITDLDSALSKPPCMKIYRKDCIRYSFTNCIPLNTRGCYVRYFDHNKKELVEFEYERPTGQIRDGLIGAMVDTLEGRGQQERVIMRDEMQLFAKRKPPANLTHTVSLTLPGNPCLLSGAVLELPEAEWMNNADRWLITKSTHLLGIQESKEDGYMTKIELKRAD
jgi:hypothetical protein